MKVAIYIEDGVTQLVLTPESEWEKSATFKLVGEGERALTVHRGSFYHCRGGWTRQGDGFSGMSAYGAIDDDSLILRVEPKRLAPVVVSEESSDA